MNLNFLVMLRSRAKFQPFSEQVVPPMVSMGSDDSVVYFALQRQVDNSPVVNPHLVVLGVSDGDTVVDRNVVEAPDFHGHIVGSQFFRESSCYVHGEDSHLGLEHLGPYSLGNMDDLASKLKQAVFGSSKKKSSRASPFSCSSSVGILSSGITLGSGISENVISPHFLLGLPFATDGHPSPISSSHEFGASSLGLASHSIDNSSDLASSFCPAYVGCPPVSATTHFSSSLPNLIRSGSPASGGLPVQVSPFSGGGSSSGLLPVQGSLQHVGVVGSSSGPACGYEAIYGKNLGGSVPVLGVIDPVHPSISSVPSIFKLVPAFPNFALNNLTSGRAVSGGWSVVLT